MTRSPKEVALKAIEGLPDDATYDDIRYSLYVCEKIDRGLRDAETGNLVDHEDVKREIDEWLRSAGRR